MHIVGWTSNEIDSTYHLHLRSMPLFFNRRESPWKVDVESSGVPAKLRLLEQELINLEKVVNGDLSKIPLAMRKQVKRYQTLAGKIDDLCKRMVGLLIWIAFAGLFLLNHSQFSFPWYNEKIHVCWYFTLPLHMIVTIQAIHCQKTVAVSSSSLISD